MEWPSRLFASAKKLEAGRICVCGRNCMLIDSLRFALERSGCLDEFWGKLDAAGDGTLGVANSARPFLVAARFSHRPQTTLVVVAGEEAAIALRAACRPTLAKTRCCAFPSAPIFRLRKSRRGSGHHRAPHGGGACAANRAPGGGGCQRAGAAAHVAACGSEGCRAADVCRRLRACRHAGRTGSGHQRVR